MSDPAPTAADGAARAQEAIVTGIGADLLASYLSCCQALLSGARVTGQGVDPAVLGRWEAARDSALAAQRLCSAHDLARIGAAALQLRMAGEPHWPD